MKTLDKKVTMEINSDVAMSRTLEALSKINGLIEAKRKMAIGAILFNYKEGELTKMQAAEILGLDRENMDKLLIRHDMPTIMNVTEEDMDLTAKTRREYANRLGLNTK